MKREDRIEQTIWHEVGYVIMSLHHGIFPIMVIIDHNGWRGCTMYHKREQEEIKRKHKDILLAGYTWVRFFME